MNAAAQPRKRIVPIIVQQHVEEAVSLYSIRSALVNAPHVRLRNLSGFDARLAAHLEGMQIAGDAARPLCAAALEVAEPGTVFVATMWALDTGDRAWLRQLLALSESEPGCRRGLHSAFGWTEKARLRGVVADYLRSELPFARVAALAACGQHRVDPNLGSARILDDPDPAVRACAYRIAGELGKREFVSGLATAAGHEKDPDCQFWASWSAVLLGDRDGALELLKSIAACSGSLRVRALQLAFQAVDAGAARALLQSIARHPADIRQVIRGAGLSGDSAYIPRLIELMSQDALARIAGEAFSIVTGVDSVWLDLERQRPQSFESGTNDDPNDPNVELDEDDGLPWPDQKLVQAWWHANSHRFQSGLRYFMGEPLNRDNCVRVLKEGFQRQRIAAALYLSLLNPGAPLFEWRAPAWRQAPLLAQMS